MGAHDDLPARIAVHWGVTGASDRFLRFHRDRRDGRTRHLPPRPSSQSVRSCTGRREAQPPRSPAGSRFFWPGSPSGAPWHLAAAVPAPASPGGGGSAQLSWVHFSWGPLFSGGVDPTRRCTPVRESPCRRTARLEVSPTTGSPGSVGPPWRAAGLDLVSVLGLLAVVWVALSGLPWVLRHRPNSAFLAGNSAAPVVIDRPGCAWSPPDVVEGRTRRHRPRVGRHGVTHT